MKRLLFVIVLLSLIGCSTNDKDGVTKTFTLDDFKIIELRENDATIYQNYGIFLGNPMIIKYHPDGYIILFDSKPEGLITSIDTQTNEIDYYVKRGRGPTELSNITDVCIKNGDVWVSNLSDNKILRLETIPNKRGFHIKQEGKLDGYFYRAVPYRENNVLTLPASTTSDRFYMLDADRKVIDTLGVMPSVAKTEMQPSNGIYQSTISISPNSNNVVTACVNFEVIDIYDESMKLVCSLRGPYGVNSGVEKRNIGTGYQIVNKPLWDTFSNVISTNDTFWVGFIGENPQNSNELAQVGINKILSFNWNGKALKAYNLPKKIIAFDIDHKNNKLYGITNDAEPQIVIYNL